MEIRPLCTLLDITLNVPITYVLLNLEVARCPFIAATTGTSSSPSLWRMCQAFHALHCPLPPALHQEVDEKRTLWSDNNFDQWKQFLSWSYFQWTNFNRSKYISFITAEVLWLFLILCDG